MRLSLFPSTPIPPTHTRSFPVAGRLGGPISFLCMRPAGTEERVSRDFRGREDCHDIGILIEVREKDFSIDISAHMERAAYRALNFVDNWRARDSTEGFVIERADTAPFSAEKAEEALRAGIRTQFPALEDFDISIIREKDRLATLAPVYSALQTRTHAHHRFHDRGEYRTILRLHRMPPLFARPYLHHHPGQDSHVRGAKLFFGQGLRVLRVGSETLQAPLGNDRSPPASVQKGKCHRPSSRRI